MQRFTTDANFPALAVLLNGGSVRHRHPCLNLLPTVATSLEANVYREKRVRKKLLFLISNSGGIFPSVIHGNKANATTLTSFASF